MPVGSKITINPPDVELVPTYNRGPRCTARSSRGLGRRPLKAEISGSNPLRATSLFWDDYSEAALPAVRGWEDAVEVVEMLSDAQASATIAVTDVSHAKSFYRNTLGLNI